MPPRPFPPPAKPIPPPVPAGGPQPAFAPLTPLAPAVDPLSALEAEATMIRQAILTNAQFVASPAGAAGSIPPATLQALQARLQTVIAAQTAIVAASAVQAAPTQSGPIVNGV